MANSTIKKSPFACTPYQGDLNDLTVGGAYLLQPNCSHTPTDSITSYGGMMFVLPFNQGVSFQILASITGRA